MRRSATMINRRRAQHGRAVSDSSSIMQEKKSLLDHGHAYGSRSLNEKRGYDGGLRRTQSTVTPVSRANSMLKPLPTLPIDAPHPRRAPPTRRPSHAKPAETSSSASAASSFPSVPTTTPKSKAKAPSPSSFKDERKRTAVAEL